MTTQPVIGKVLDYQAKQIIYNVYSYFKRRKLDPTTYEHKQDINLISIVAEATRLSKSTVTRVIREGNNLKTENGVVKFLPQDKKKHVRKKRIEVNEFTEGVIRRKVIQFYTVKKEVPSIRKLNELLNEEEILNCSNEFLRQLLHKLGFTNAENSSTGIMRERPDIVSQRFSYLQTLRAFRTKRKPIFYLNETKLWHSSEDGANSSKPGLPALVAVHANTGTGFGNGDVIMLKLKSKGSNDYDNSELLENYKWVKEKFLQEIPVSSLIVLNTPVYVKTEAAKDVNRPTATATRGVMQEWLKKNNIPFKDTDPKNTLCQIINNLDAQDTYRLDKILMENGHDVIHLPPNHNDINPVLIAWEEMKESTTAPKTLLTKYTKEKWQKCFDQVKENEEEYYEHDAKFDAAVDNLLSTVKVEKDDSDDENDDDEPMEFTYGD